MIVQNKLIEESFDFRSNLQCCELTECILALGMVDAHIRAIGERINFDEEKLYSQEILKSVTLADFFWGTNTEGVSEDHRSLLLEILTKQPKSAECDSGNSIIGIYLYPDCGNHSHFKDYLNNRRDILSTLTDRRNFYLLLHSCFPDSLFSLDIEAGLNSIKKFSNHTSEIVKNLTVLNDEAVKAFKEHRENIFEAFRVIKSQLLDCVPDKPENDTKLTFDFIDDEGDTVSVVCSPHTKLVAKHSDCRIYFYWCHEKIGSEEKVLIGRIGTHPY